MILSEAPVSYFSGSCAVRLKSGIWVAAYLRRCNIEGAFAAVRRRGAEEAGAIFIKVNRLDGTAMLVWSGAAIRLRRRAAGRPHVHRHARRR